jgi:hypothetical protein
LARDTVREVVVKWERHDWAYIMVVFWRGGISKQNFEVVLFSEK